MKMSRNIVSNFSNHDANNKDHAFFLKYPPHKVGLLGLQSLLGECRVYQNDSLSAQSIEIFKLVDFRGNCPSAISISLSQKIQLVSIKSFRYFNARVSSVIQTIKAWLTGQGVRLQRMK